MKLLGTQGIFGIAVLAGVALSGNPGTAHAASTACYIYVQGDCHGWVPQGTWFADDYNGSAYFPEACLARADQYLRWCGLRTPGGDQVNAAFNVGPVTIRSRVLRLDFQFEGFGPTAFEYGYNWTPVGPPPRINLWITPSRLDPHALPLGDKKIVYDAPRKGNVFACDPFMFNQPNGVDNRLHRGPWVNEAAGTIDITRKPSVGGAVFYPNARFSASPRGPMRVIEGNALPVGVPAGNFPIRSTDPAFAWDTNPNAIREQNISFAIPMAPAPAPAAACVYKHVGITLDGVPIAAAPGDTGLDELSITLQDSCGGLSQPGGLYHRHFLSNCTPHIRERAALVGYALDGYGIYSPYDERGRELTSADLDECHGIVSPVVWEGRRVNVYHYVMTRDYPYTVSCFRGKPVRNAFPPLPGAPPETK